MRGWLHSGIASTAWFDPQAQSEGWFHKGLIGQNAAASGLWTPADLSTPSKLWLQGDLLTGTNGDSISTWDDSSTANNDATVPIPTAERPTLVTSGLNSLNVVRLDAANSQFFGLPDAITTGHTEGSGFFVAKINADPPALAARSSTVFANFGTDTSNEHYPFTDGNVYDGFLSNGRKNTGNPSANLAAWHIGGFQSKASDWRLYINAALHYSTTSNTFATSATIPNIGSSSLGGANYFDGDIAEIIYVDSFLSQAEREQIEGYLAHKWGITSVLDAAHPYKTTAPTNGIAAISGTSSGTIALTGTAASTVLVSAASAGSLSYTGSATGVVPVAATSAGAFNLTGSSAGGAPALAADATGSIAFAGSSTGTVGVSASSTGQFGLTGTAEGAVRIAVTGSGAFALAGSSNAAVRVSGDASGAFALTGSAQASIAVAGQTSGQFGITGASSAQVAITGSSSGTIGFTGASSAAAQQSVQADASGSLALTGSGAGSAAVAGSAQGSMSLGGQAGVSVKVAASSSGSFSITGQASASAVVGASASGSFGLTGSVEGSVTLAGQVSGSIGFDGSAGVRLLVQIEVIGNVHFVGIASGQARIPMPPSDERTVRTDRPRNVRIGPRSRLVTSNHSRRRVA